MVDLNERKKKILQVLIHCYTHTAQPVGSKTIAENYDLGLSPASIRNCLTELETEGYLSQPHISAGRVPTDRGYRFYVDSLIEVQCLVIEEKEKIRQEYFRRMKNLEEVLESASHLLARISNYTGFVLFPKWRKSILESLQFIPLENKILVVLVTHGGLIGHYLLDNPGNISSQALSRLSRMLTRKLRGLSLAEAKEKIYQKIEEEEKSQREFFILAREIIGQAFLEKEEIYLEGTSNIVGLPEFEKTINLFRFIEERKLLARFLEKELNRPGVKVRIGRENPFPEMSECSLVTSVYQNGKQSVGLLGILGPKRMEYSRMISVVDTISRAVSKVLEQISVNG